MQNSRRSSRSSSRVSFDSLADPVCRGYTLSVWTQLRTGYSSSYIRPTVGRACREPQMQRTHD